MPVDAYMHHKEAAQLYRPQNLSDDCLSTCATLQQSKLT